jgi:hypothetical protein
MLENVNQVDIRPYLNPKFWDGHTLGFGVAQDGYGGGYSYSDSRSSRKVINTRLRSNNVFPLHTFTTGDTFNPAGYEPGTVVLFRQDKMYGDRVEPDYSIDELAKQSLPLRETTTFPSFGERTPLTLSKQAVGDSHYLSQVRWGVVLRDKTESFISSTPASSVFERGVNVRAYMPFINKKGQITIGETVHSRAPSSCYERLRRINILHIIAFGEPERQKRRFLGFAGRTALNGSV